ncbi:IclR family transcriptional regulator [Xanthobacter sp. V4C-4]|uniref:IclR family transcriptional regulator n=1 Tax=Xanthobacter cornucopiae TaxID=3119924 RepID=UPI003727BE8C
MASLRPSAHAQPRGAAESGARDGAQAIDRAVSVLQGVGRAGQDGARLADLIIQCGLQKPTVRRLLLALMRGGLVEQDGESRRYFLGPEAYVLGTLAGARFGIHALSLDGLARLAKESGDCAFLSVPRDAFCVCLHREEGAFPIRTHVLQAGDRHPLGIGGGGLAILAALPDAAVDEVIATNTALLAQRYPTFPPPVLRALVADARALGYALNPGLLVPGSWGLGVAVRDGAGRPLGALSIAAIESRLSPARQPEIAALLRREARLLEAALHRASRAPSSPHPPARPPRPNLKVKA